MTPEVLVQEKLTYGHRNQMAIASYDGGRRIDNKGQCHFLKQQKLSVTLMTF